jgi:1-acyl-sn-glycerol-3-phosphate acyltransferase
MLSSSLRWGASTTSRYAKVESTISQPAQQSAHETRTSHVQCTFKSEILMYPGIGWMLWLSGHIPVVRGNKSSGKQVVATAGDFVQSGIPVLFFPEATRRVDTATGPLADFKPGAFKTAVERGADILPVTLSGARSLLPPFGFPSLGFGDVEIILHPPISTEGMQVRDAAGNFTDAVDKLRMQSWHAIAGGLRDVDHKVIGSDAQRAKATPGVREPVRLVQSSIAAAAAAAETQPGTSYADITAGKHVSDNDAAPTAASGGQARRRGRREE